MDYSLVPTLIDGGKSVSGYISSKFNVFRNFRRNVDAIGKDMERLMNLKTDLKEKLDLARKEGKLPIIQVREWLKEAEGVEAEVSSMETEIAANENSFHGCCQNYRLRYKLSKKALEKSEEVKRVIASGSFPTAVAITPRPRAVEQMPAPSVAGQTAATEILDQLLNLLKDDEIRRIGVWGMGGVGKTTLVKNLNNKLQSRPLAKSFNIVIWVTVSQDMDLRKIQSQIAERLNFPLNEAESTETRAKKLRKRLKEKFLLILDDVWDGIDFDKVGIPQSKDQSEDQLEDQSEDQSEDKSEDQSEDHQDHKIILTTRSLEVCRMMMTDKDIRVNVLGNQEAWNLFCSNAGAVVNLDHIKSLAEAVNKECSGLPLAIVTVARAMRGKTKVELWKDALSELRKSVPNIRGVEKDVFAPLKWSYDSLEGQNIKPCFLYCCLFPEDLSIEVNELVQCWLAEGLLDKQQNLEESHNRGIALIENLKDCCMLESGPRGGTVKMHDVIRDVAIWIASSSKDECKFRVQSGLGLSHLSDVEMWDSFVPISFVDNRITSLPDHVMQSSKVSTLILQGNLLLCKAPVGFLDGFIALRVLNLSDVQIRSLPFTLQHLKQLRALLLRNCNYLEKLPPVGGLGRLEILNLSNTRLKELPEGMKELSNLRQLNLADTHHLEIIKEGTMSSLCSLEQLDMSRSGYKWKIKVAKGTASFEELISLENLFEIYIMLPINCFAGKKLDWLKRLRKFRFFVGLGDFEITPHGKHVDRMLVVCESALYRGELEECLTSTSALVLDRCRGVIEMCEKFSASGVTSFDGLKSLTVTNSTNLNREPKHVGSCSLLLPNLEELNLHHVDLKSISNLTAIFRTGISGLRKIQVTGCQYMTIIIPFDLSHQLNSLEEIEVTACHRMTTLIGESPKTSIDLLPRLRVLKLERLSKLGSVCLNSVWPNIERIEVKNCPLLSKLPLCTANASAIRLIKGEMKWWDQLQWYDDDTKLSLEPFFQPYI